MQTFLPYIEFDKSAACLDNKRLGKQILEAQQIIVKLVREEYPNKGYAHHPAVLMWMGYPDMLAAYGCFLFQEWYNRGFRSHVKAYEFFQEFSIGSYAVPTWYGDTILHSSHRSNLLFKDFDFYSKNQWEEANTAYIPYVWPSYYTDFRKKILSKTGIKNYIKALKRRGLWIEDHFLWPGSNQELEISLGSSKLVSV